MKRGRVLIVDDEAAIRSLLAIIARRAGCTVDLAVDGVDAIRLLGENEYDVVLLDLMMPRINGYEVIDFLKRQRVKATVFVVTATPNIFFRDFDPEIVRSIIRKPFDVEVVASIIADAALSERDDSTAPLLEDSGPGQLQIC